MFNKIIEKLFDKLLDLMFEPIWVRIIMMVVSPSISVYFVRAYEPLFLWFAGLIGFGFILVIINQANTYRSNKKDKDFHETFLKLRYFDKGNDSALIEIDSKKNIDYHNISNVYYDIKNKPIVIVGIAFIKPIYNKPKSTLKIRGEGNSYAVVEGLSFYEERDFIYNMTPLLLK